MFLLFLKNEIKERGLIYDLHSNMFLLFLLCTQKYTRGNRIYIPICFYYFRELEY